MSNLSQFFATGGNKIKSIQRVQAIQLPSVVAGVTVYRWDGVTATISAVDVNKTILVYNTNASSSSLAATPGGLTNRTVYNHYPFLASSTTITFNGPSSPTTTYTLDPIPARLEVQIIEFQ